MPPKGEKRSRAPSPTAEPATASEAKKSARQPKPAAKPPRSPAALASLAEKKTEAMLWKDVVPFVRRTREEDFSPADTLKLITWNVSGLRGLLKKTPSALADLLQRTKPDALCLQETKLNVGDLNNTTLGVVDGYTFVDHPCAAKKGYSGTRTYLKTAEVAEQMHTTVTCGFEPRSTAKDFVSTAQSSSSLPHNGEESEGRVLTSFLRVPRRGAVSGSAAASDAATLALVNTYVPNSGMTLDRLPYRVDTFDVRMRRYLAALEESCRGEGSGVVWTGDLNVAERDYDRYFSGSYRAMQECSGFTPEERASFRETLHDKQMSDAFRALYPTAGPAYTFWSARINGRARNAGWRLDYFVVSQRLVPYVLECCPLPEVMGSDHCPLQLWLRKP